MAKVEDIQDLQPLIHRVETALDNLRDCMDLAQRSVQKRRHPRYQKRQLVVEYQLFQTGSSQLSPESRRQTLVDVSAGGMRMDIGGELAVEKGQRMKFAIYKPTKELILSGTALVVRISDNMDSTRTLGIQFQVLKN